MKWMESEQERAQAVWSLWMEQRLRSMRLPSTGIEWAGDVAAAAAFYCARDTGGRPLQNDEIDRLLIRALQGGGWHAGSGSRRRVQEAWSPLMNAMILSGAFRWRVPHGVGERCSGILDLGMLFRGEAEWLEIKCREVLRRACECAADAFPREEDGSLALRGLVELSRRMRPRARAAGARQRTGELLAFCRAVVDARARASVRRPPEVLLGDLLR